MERAIVRKKGWIIVTSLVVIVVIAVIGGKVYMDNQESKKIEYQKETAVKIKQTISGLKELEFNENGGSFSKTENDWGKWSINVRVKLIDSKWYSIDASRTGVEMMKSGFPNANMHEGTTNPIKVIYSDKHEEILK